MELVWDFKTMNVFPMFENDLRKTVDLRTLMVIFNMDSKKML